MASNCVVVFHFPSMCVLMSISAAYVTIGSYISRVSTNYTFAIVYKGRHTKEMSVIDEPVHVAVRLQLQSNFGGSNSSGPSMRVRPIHVFERYLA